MNWLFLLFSIQIMQMNLKYYCNNLTIAIKKYLKLLIFEITSSYDHLFPLTLFLQELPTFHKQSQKLLVRHNSDGQSITLTAVF